jgi:hypothetical protein
MHRDNDKALKTFTWSASRGDVHVTLPCDSDSQYVLQRPENLYSIDVAHFISNSLLDSCGVVAVGYQMFCCVLTLISSLRLLGPRPCCFAPLHFDTCRKRDLVSYYPHLLRSFFQVLEIVMQQEMRKYHFEFMRHKKPARTVKVLVMQNRHHKGKVYVPSMSAMTER